MNAVKKLTKISTMILLNSVLREWAKDSSIICLTTI